MAERTLLVTGSGGLVGHAVLRLAGAGYRRVGFDAAPPRDPPPGVILLGGDLRDPLRLVEVLRAERVTHLVHAAAISHPGMLLDQPATVVAINLRGTEHVLEAARLCRVERLVFLSSAAVYGARGRDERIDEASPLAPDSMYGATKAAAEQLLAGYRAQYGLAAVMLRPASVYGPRRQTFSVVSYLVASALAGQPARVPGGDQVIDLTYMDDVAEAVLLALEHPRALGRTYTIASGVQHSYAEIAAVVRAHLPAADVTLQPGAGELGEEGRYDVSRAAEELGFRAHTTLDQGVAAVAAELAARPDLRRAALEAARLLGQ
jgi:UDP-glucuronate 4-epimerase